ncbi:hypothetical protein RRG08_035736 [Elysia crispata]|uniref:Uncharacterized protein n=1 Tax=Elysia crispata TaxID=231223 RepID=A0AAE1D020_9GAST|nr:hypothetical protein RRG08_035736 [Elysia crispata]
MDLNEICNSNDWEVESPVCALYRPLVAGVISMQLDGSTCASVCVFVSKPGSKCHSRCQISFNLQCSDRCAVTRGGDDGQPPPLTSRDPTWFNLSPDVDRSRPVGSSISPRFWAARAQVCVILPLTPMLSVVTGQARDWSSHTPGSIYTPIPDRRRLNFYLNLCQHTLSSLAHYIWIKTIH